MNKSKLTYLCFILLFSSLIFFMVSESVKLKTKLIELDNFESVTESIRFQPSANVPCKDTENYGSGTNRQRICAHGTTYWCDWEDYNVPANTGTCTISQD